MEEASQDQLSWYKTKHKFLDSALKELNNNNYKHHLEITDLNVYVLIDYYFLFNMCLLLNF